MRRYLWLAALAIPVPAAAQDPLQDLLRRVDALERENATLKQEVSRLSARVGQPDTVPLAERQPASRNDEATAVVPDQPVWSGAYIGVNAGISESRFDYRSLDTTSNAHAASTDPAFGGQIGYRWQSGSLITGIGLDLSFPQDAQSRLPTGPSSVLLDMKWNARAAGQIGFAFGPILAYGTAGLQSSRIRYATPRVNRDLAYREANPSALFYGVGIAAMLNDGLSLELEATKADLGLLPGTNTIEGRSRTLMLRVNQQLK